MKNNAKRNLRNAVRTGGKYALKGVKMAGIGALTTTEIAAKGIRAVANNKDARKLLAKGLVLGASVAFPVPMIMIAGMNYMVQNCVMGKNTTAVGALLETPNALNKILDNVLDVAAGPTAAIAKEVEKASKNGKTALER